MMEAKSWPTDMYSSKLICVLLANTMEKQAVVCNIPHGKNTH